MPWHLLLGFLIIPAAIAFSVICDVIARFTQPPTRKERHPDWNAKLW